MIKIYIVGTVKNKKVSIHGATFYKHKAQRECKEKGYFYEAVYLRTLSDIPKPGESKRKFPKGEE